jgi:Zn-dependent peptidase ImmA (M78 family)
MVMKYKELYKELAHQLSSLGCFVCDIDMLGHCKHTEDSKAFIYIKPSMSFKAKYFVLAHEAGHLFYKKGEKIFNWSKTARSEEEANTFALQLLESNDIDSHGYCKLYSKAKKASKKRKKSWFEL